ncbi:MAG: TetR/AcrR family transcriptional regulator [Spirochaetales bacterium]|nr:TetR/AcrR family transcriptional regulator [Spirochaetales bacterium]
MSLGAMGGTFLRFSPDRRKVILDRCIDLFNRHGYDGCSTNILKDGLKVAKGTFYKYIVSKEDLYLYLSEKVLKELTELQNDSRVLAPPDIIERFSLLNDRFLDYYSRDSRSFIFLMNILVNPSAPLYDRIEKRRRELVGEHMDAFLSGIDWSLYRYDRHKVLRLAFWAVNGFRQELYERLVRGDDPDTIAEQARDDSALLTGMLKAALLRSPGD